MKLVLVDASFTGIGYGGNDVECPYMRVRVERNSLKSWIQNQLDDLPGDEGDEVKNMWLSKILQDNVSDLEIAMTLRGEVGKVEMRMARPCLGSYGDDCLLEKLWNAYQEGIKLSLDIKYAASEDEPLEDFASFPDMGIFFKKMIFEDGFVCEGTAKTDMTSFAKTPRVHVRIVADILGEVKDVRLLFSKKQLEDGFCADVTIVAGNGCEMKSYKYLLSCSSPVFAEMFQGKTKQSKTGRVKMPGISEDAVRAILNFIHSKDLDGPKKNLELAFEVFKAAEKYDMARLREKVNGILLCAGKKVFNLEFAVKVYLFTKNLASAEDLKTKALEILKEKYNESELLYGMFEKHPEVAMDVTGESRRSSSSRRCVLM